MVHFYRGEMYRSQIWRSRLDTTTNWAVLTVAAMTSFSFGDPDLAAWYRRGVTVDEIKGLERDLARWKV